MRAPPPGDRTDGASDAAASAAGAAAPGAAGGASAGASSGPPAAAPSPAEPAGALVPLRHPVFRMLWVTWLMANTCMWMNDVASAWLMTSLSPSPVMVALVQSASTLPMFLLGLPSGALADIIDRRQYLMLTQFWVAVVAVVLSLAVATGTLAAPALLALVFVNGVGLAMRLPVFAAIVPELVPREQLPQALALNGIAMNTSRIIGPILAGALIASTGIVTVFALNAVLSVVSGFVVMRWKREREVSALPGERFLGAMRVGVQYVRQSMRIRIVLLRVSMFFLQSIALMALLPLIARRLHGGDAASFTLLLASMGFGAILAALLVMPRLRGNVSRDDIVRYGTLLQAAATLVVAFSPNLWVASPAMMAGGVAWLSVANTLSVSAQSALPDWVRARGMSIFQMALMGSSAIGAGLWGQVASLSDVRTSLVLAALAGLAGLVLLRRFRLDAAADEDLTPVEHWVAPTAVEPVAAEAGPVLVTIEYVVDAQHADEFRGVMEASRRSRLRHGALSWELFRDTSDPTRWIEYFIDETWVEHLRRFDRVTAADNLLREQRRRFGRDGAPPKVTRHIADAAMKQL